MDQDWQLLTHFFPYGWEDLAISTNAVKGLRKNQGSRYLVIDFSHPWLKSTRQRAKLRAATVLRPLTFALNEQSVYLPQ